MPAAAKAAGGLASRLLIERVTTPVFDTGARQRARNWATSLP